MPETFRVFLSAVSSECEIARSAVASDLIARGLKVREQKFFTQATPGLSTLQKLHDYIRDCDAVVAIMGARAGWPPPEAAAEPFRAMLPQGVATASMTQWEIHFARHHRRKTYYFEAGPDWVPDRPGLLDDDARSQAALKRHLFDGTLGLDRTQFSSIHELRAEVLRQPWPDLRHAKPVHPRFTSIGTLFKGRDGAVAQLRTSLTKGGRTAVTNKAHALHGLGGVGKTRLAIEYGLQHQAEYAALLFLSGETPEQLDSDLANLCGVLALDAAALTDDPAKIAAALAWLGANPGWYLVIDNLDTPAALARATERLAHIARGHVVVTTRLAHHSALFESLELDVLAPEDAAAFLLERTAPRRRKAADDPADAHAIALDLGGLALAVEQAGAHVAHRRLTLGAYRAAWTANRAEVLAWTGPGVTDYPRSVAITWLTSIQQLTPPGLRLLQRLAFLAPEPIPESLLDVTWNGAPPDDPHAALADLAAYSLATSDPNNPTFVVHRLVQDVTRTRLGADDLVRSAGEAMRWVNAAFVGDPEDVRTWPRLTPLEPHMRQTIEHALLLPEPGEITRPMNQLGRLLLNKARTKEAEPLMRRALAIDEASYGNDHPNVAIRLNNLAQLLQETNRLREAEPLMRRALAIDEASYGNDHPRVATDLNNLAQLLQATNRLGEAEPLMRRALAIDEASYGNDHPRVAIHLNNLARLLQATNRLGEAEPLMRRALAIDEASYGNDHPSVAIGLNNLAQLLQATNRLGEAEPLFRRALAIDEASYGNDHPRVATHLNNLAGLLQATNRLGEAEPLMRRALAIDEASYGNDHPEVATDLNNLAALLQATNRLGEAEPLMRRVVEIFVAFTATTGHPHPHLEAAFGNYRHLVTAMGRPEPDIHRLLSDLLEPILPILATRPDQP